MLVNEKLVSHCKDIVDMTIHDRKCFKKAYSSSFNQISFSHCVKMIIENAVCRSTVAKGP